MRFKNLIIEDVLFFIQSLKRLSVFMVTNVFNRRDGSNLCQAELVSASSPIQMLLARRALARASNRVIPPSCHPEAGVSAVAERISTSNSTPNYHNPFCHPERSRGAVKQLLNRVFPQSCHPDEGGISTRNSL